MKYIRLFESRLDSNHKKYLISHEIDNDYTYVIWFIYKYRESINVSSLKKYNIKAKKIFFFDKDGNKIPDWKIPETHREVLHLRDIFHIFNPQYNKMYYETDNLKDAKEMIKVLLNSKKYNL